MRLSVRRQGLRKRLRARLRAWSRYIDEEAPPTNVAAGLGSGVQGELRSGQRDRFVLFPHAGAP